MCVHNQNAGAEVAAPAAFGLVRLAVAAGFEPAEGSLQGFPRATASPQRWHAPSPNGNLDLSDLERFQDLFEFRLEIGGFARVSVKLPAHDFELGAGIIRVARATC